MCSTGKEPNLPETSHVRVTQLASIIKCKENVGVRRYAFSRIGCYELAGHPQVNHQRQALTFFLALLMFWRSSVG